MHYSICSDLVSFSIYLFNFYIFFNVFFLFIFDILYIRLQSSVLPSSLQNEKSQVIHRNNDLENMYGIPGEICVLMEFGSSGGSDTISNSHSREENRCGVSSGLTQRYVLYE